MFKLVGKKEITVIIAGLKNKSVNIKTLSIKVLHKIGERIIMVDYDGYNMPYIHNRMFYFDNLKRWQKECFVQENLFRLNI